jgi:hypothetical protein
MPNTETTETTTQASGNLSVNRVAVKIPPYWKKKPDAWFRQIEASFRTAGVTTDQTKYDHVLANLETQIVDDIDDFFTTEPTENKYDSLKARLIKYSQGSETERVTKLLKHVELGDRKPSAMLREMKQLAGDNFASVIEPLFIQRVPELIGAIVTASQIKELDKKAELADKIMEINPQMTQVSSISTESTNNEIAALRKEIQQNFKQIGRRMDDYERTRSQSRSNSRQRLRNRSPKQSPERSDWCWYHNEFKSRAKKCKPPCSFNKSSGN